MNTPKLISGEVTGSLVSLSFSAPLNSAVPLIAEYFACNGQTPTVVNYSSSDSLQLELPFSTGNVYLNYLPVELESGIRGIGGDNSSTSNRILAVKPIENYLLSRVSAVTNTNLSDNYPRSGPTEKPTVGDYINAFTMKEAIEISNPDNASVGSVNFSRIEMAIDDADALIQNYITQATAAGIRLISSNRRRTTLTIARYFLDSVVRRRPDIEESYKEAIKELELKSSAVGGEVDPVTGERSSLLRTFRTEQLYNRGSRKGLHDWDTNRPGISLDRL